MTAFGSDSAHFGAVLFDCGHTLFGTLDSSAHCVAYAARHGIDIDRVEVEQMLAAAWIEARTPEEIAKGRDLDPERHRACWLALYAPLDEVAPGLAEHLYVLETGSDGWRPYPDTRPVLAALQTAGVRIGVVSDTGWDIRPLFQHADLDRFVGTYVLSYEHQRTKPASDLFWRACADLGVEPGHALMVGDTAAADGGAALIGMPVLLLPHHHDGDDRGLELVLRLVLGSAR